MASADTKKFYVTTPIYYVNARPHLGSLYSTLLADVAARYNTLQQKAVFFLTGTDEHGQKIAQAAQAVGKEPKAFVDSFIEPFKDAWRLYTINYTKFIRTTDPEHMAAVQAWIVRLMDSGDIYKSHYSGFYCTPCETFVTEKDLPHEGLLDAAPTCPSCGRITEYVSEESYFFRLSAYQERLLAFYAEHPDFITPPERMAEVRAFVESGLKDLSISRTSISWGIPFPRDTPFGDAPSGDTPFGDKPSSRVHHVTYVWADALNNYITGVGYGVPGKEADFNFWWPADLQVLGKDIVRFHAVYWPAFLMASNLAMPKKLLVHGWIKIGEHKMSKSRGNAVDPIALAETYGVDQIRYYLVRHLAITQDSPFTYHELELRINADLAHDLGNLLNRMATLARKLPGYPVITPPAGGWSSGGWSSGGWSSEASALHELGKNCTARFIAEMESGYMNRAYAIVWEYIQGVNRYFHVHEPWKLIKSAPEECAQVISATCHALQMIGILCWPLMPRKMEQLLNQIGSPLNDHLTDNALAQLLVAPWNRTFTLNQGTLLFNKIERKEEAVMHKEMPQQPVTAPCVTIDDFAKIELRVGTIESVTTVEKSEKLYRLSVNFGPEGIRQILSGIRASFTPEQLINRQGIFVFNLAPRTMMGLESQGMMIFARDTHEQLVLIAPEHTVPNGARLG